VKGRFSLLAFIVTMTMALCAIAGSDVVGKTVDPVGQRPQKNRPIEAHASRARRTPSALVYGRRTAQLPAAHRIHAQKTQLTCLSCHQNATASGRASDWLGPSKARCVECHAQRFDNAIVIEPPSSRVRISHARHAAIDCATCHGPVSERDDASGAEQLPLMSSCLTCHKRAKAARAGTDCRVCHVGSGGVMQTRFGDGLLLPSNSLGSIEHGGNWVFRHGDAAMNQGPLCLSCHKEPECVACHNSKLRPRSIHPSDYLQLHGIEARQQASGCVSCHRSQSECLTCHLRVGISASGPRAAEAHRGRFHPLPSIWTDRPRTGQHHAVQARLHMDECASCHQERDCAICHATAGVGGPGAGNPFGNGISPHPPGFRAQCRGIVNRNPRPCLVCHRADDWELLPCR
jgi:hypothetical protein